MGTFNMFKEGIDIDFGNHQAVKVMLLLKEIHVAHLHVCQVWWFQQRT